MLISLSLIVILVAPVAGLGLSILSVSHAVHVAYSIDTNFLIYMQFTSVFCEDLSGLSNCSSPV